jgi:methylenetetrahydrofolate dehydrogenase (NADP+)/methenyltetrahydrofolate cyclohydrolase
LQQGAKVQFILDYKAKKPLNCHLLVLSAGSPELVKGEYISEKCSVVDFGSSVINNKTIGDLDLKSAIGHLGVVSPSPGGMGPLVTRFLIMNFLGI